METLCRLGQTGPHAASAGEPSALLPSWRLHLEAANLSPRTIRAYTDDGALFVAFLARQGMPTAARSIRQRTAPSSAATRFRSLQQLFGWLDEEGEPDGSPMAKMRPPKIPDKPVPVLPDEDVRRGWRTAQARTSATGGPWPSSGRSWTPGCGSRAWPASLQR